MQHEAQYLTAESAAGRDAIAEVMRHCYEAEVDAVPPDWALARVADGKPVSFLLLDPNRSMEFPGGCLRYAFICDVGTREDRRRQGHFRAIVDEAATRLREAGVALLGLHGAWALYRPLGFARFTHHSGIFMPVATVRRELGPGDGDGVDRLRTIEGATVPGLLVVSRVEAQTVPECLSALRQAATLAERAGKSRLLFEEPEAPSYGSSYPIRHSLETPFVAVARALGASHVVCGDDPEDGPVADADCLKVLDSAPLLRQVLPLLSRRLPLPDGAVTLANDAGTATILVRDGVARVLDGEATGATLVRWPAQSLAQLVTGYRSATLLDALHGSALAHDALRLLDALFPPYWRLTRNENWTFAR